MYTSQSFKFHRFSDVPMNNQSILMSKYFPKTMDNNLLSNRLYNSKESKKEKEIGNNNNLTANKIKSLKLLQFDNNNSNNINNNDNEFLLEIQNQKNNLFNNFPIKEIINIDFENIINNEGTKNIIKYINPMVYQSLDIDNSNILIFKKNNQFKSLILKYQHILQYLYYVEKKMNEYYKAMEKMPSEVYNINNKIDEEDIKINKIIEEKENEIKYLENKINVYKKLLLLNNKEKHPLISTVLDIHDENFNYYCDICPDDIFKSYQEVQIHYLNEHSKILKIREKNLMNLQNISVNNSNYEKFYFDNKMNSIKNELKNLLFEINKNKEQDYDRKKMNNLKRDVKNYTNQKNQNQSNKNSSSKTLDLKNIDDNEIDIDNFDKRLNNFERLQKNYNDTLYKDFDNFKSEIFIQLNNIKNNKPISIPSNINKMNNLFK